MLAFFRGWSGVNSDLAPRIANSLGLFRGKPAPCALVDGAIFSSCGHRPSLSERGWRVTRVASGRNVLFAGFIDNADNLADALGVASDDCAALYGAAHDRWGDDADLHVVGDYCGLIDDPRSRTIRLSRSPWRAPPLHYFRNDREVCVASVPRVLLACGLPAQLDRQRLIENHYLLHDSDRGWYRNSHHVDLGCSVHIDPVGRKLRRYYDMMAPRETRLGSRQEYVEATDALLREACSKTLGSARDPGLLLSGGLDSSNVATRVLDCLPPKSKLKTFTFRPRENYVEPDHPRYFGDDGPAVMQFAAMHPRIDPWFTRNEGNDFDTGLDKLFLAMGIANIHLPNAWHYHALVGEAARAGCDMLVDADYGNRTFSNDGSWAFSEYLLRGRFRQLRLALGTPSVRYNSGLRNLLSRSIAPMLPDAMWAAWRKLRGGREIPANDRVGALRPEVIEAHGLRARARREGRLFDRPHLRDRRAFMADAIGRGEMHMGDVTQGFEQVHGIVWRDVTAYRPFVEFCLGLPTELFMHDGQQRWLARELGKGLMPEEQRLNPAGGVHSCDWHERLTPRLPELRAELERASRDPELAEFIDFGRLLQTIDNWPAASSLDDEALQDCAMAIPRAIMTARFVRHVDGRNDW